MNTQRKELYKEYRAFMKAYGMYKAWPKQIEKQMTELINDLDAGYFKKVGLKRQVKTILKQFKGTFRDADAVAHSVDALLESLDVEGQNDLVPEFVVEYMQKSTDQLLRMVAGYQRELKRLRFILKVADFNKKKAAEVTKHTHLGW